MRGAKGTGSDSNQKKNDPRQIVPGLFEFYALRRSLNVYIFALFSAYFPFFSYLNLILSIYGGNRFFLQKSRCSTIVYYGPPNNNRYPNHICHIGPDGFGFLLI